MTSAIDTICVNCGNDPDIGPHPRSANPLTADQKEAFIRFLANVEFRTGVAWYVFLAEEAGLDNMRAIRTWLDEELEWSI